MQVYNKRGKLSRILYIILVMVILSYPNQSIVDAKQSEQIPSWVQDIFVAYTENKTSEQEMINAIEYLIKKEIIKIDDKAMLEKYKKIDEYETQISALEKENNNLQQRIDDWNFRKSTNYITYSIDKIPIYADEEIVNQAIKKAFHNWERINPRLDYSETDSYGNIVIKFHKNLIVGIALGKVSTINCFDDCVIELALGDNNCESRWSQFTTESLQNTMMHEIGHMIGLRHTKISSHLMYAGHIPTDLHNRQTHADPIYDDLTYNIPLNVQEESIILDKQRLYESIDALEKRMDERLQEFGWTLKDLLEGKRESKSNVFAAHFDNTIDPLIKERNALIEKIDCYTDYQNRID